MKALLAAVGAVLVLAVGSPVAAQTYVGGEPPDVGDGDLVDGRPGAGGGPEFDPGEGDGPESDPETAPNVQERTAPTDPGAATPTEVRSEMETGDPLLVLGESRAGANGVGGGLPVTGGDVIGLTVIGLGLLATGVLVLGTRRRARQH